MSYETFFYAPISWFNDQTYRSLNPAYIPIINTLLAWPRSAEELTEPKIYQPINLQNPFAGSGSS